MPRASRADHDYGSDTDDTDGLGGQVMEQKWRVEEKRRSLDNTAMRHEKGYYSEPDLDHQNVTSPGSSQVSLTSHLSPKLNLRVGS